MQRFCFIHIEKAGGITIHNLLHHNFLFYFSPNPSFGEYFTLKQLNALKITSLNNIQGVGGHMLGCFLGYEEVLGNDLFYFTFMREPISRFLSHLNWQNNIMKKGWTIETFCQQGYFHNFQCYRLSGKRSYDRTLKEIIDKKVFVGLLEEYDKSLVLLKKHFPQPLAIEYEHSNIKEYNQANVIRFDSLSGEQKQLVIDVNKEDIKLYSYVKDELFESYENWMSDVDKQAEIHKRRNAGFVFPKKTLLKRKLSNKFVSLAIQSIIK